MVSAKLIGLVAGATMLATAACGGAAAPPGASPPSSTTETSSSTSVGTQPATAIRIGFTSSVTGSLNSESKEQTQGLQLWADTVNAAGGIQVGQQKLPVQLKSYDDQSKQDQVQQLYTRLITNDKVDFLISPYSSGMAAASAVVTEQYGKTNLLVGAADDGAFSRGYKHAFQVYTPGSKYLTGALDMLAKVDPNARKIAFVNENEPFSAGVIKAARAYAEQHGFSVVMGEGYDTGTSDFAPLITKIGGAAPDAISWRRPLRRWQHTCSAAVGKAG